MASEQAPANGSSIAKNTTYLTAALVGQKILSFLYALILARLVGVTITGDYFSALSFITLFTIFIDLGLTQAMIRQTARNPSEGQSDFQYIVTFKLLTAGLVVAALFGFIRYLDALGHAHPDILFIRWAAIIMVLDSLTNTFYGYFRGIQKLEYESIGTILHRVMVMVVGITGMILGANPIITMMALLAGSSANFLYATFHLWRRGVWWKPTINWAKLKRLLIVAIPFGVAGLFAAIYSSSDNVLLSIFSGKREVGLYGLSAKIINGFQIIPAALVAATFPAMSAAFISDREKLRRIFQYSMQYLMVFCIPLMVVLFLLAKDIILIGWGHVWLDAIWPLRFLALGLPFLFLNFPVGYLLNSANQQTRNTINIGITVAFNIALNVLFIKEFSYRSVTVISLLSSALLFFLGLWYTRRVISFPTKALLSTLGRTVLAGTVIAAFGWWFLPQVRGRSGIIETAAIMGLVYLGLIFGLKIVRREDALQLFRRLRRS